MSARLAIALAFAVLLGACSGGGGSSSSSPPATAAQSFLTTDDVKQVIAQAAGEAQARGVAAHVAVVDRVGNVLAIFRMTGAGTTTVISSGLGVTGGLEGASVSSMDAAVAKAITAAYLSSNGNAFTTRTASQIIQEHFNPGEARQPSGPLYGVQFSQLACSDVIESTPGMRNGPRPSPLGLAADPGGLPLYKSGVLVGGVGIEADNVYGIDRDIHDVDANVEEALAVAGSFGFEAPADIRADRITADGRTLRFVDSVSLAADPARAPAFAALPGDLVGLVPYNLVTLSAGTVFGSDESGVRPASMDRAGPWVLVDASGGDRFPARGTPQQHIPTSGLSQAEVEALLADAYAVARRARGQIRRPLGSSAEVSIAVVSARGVVLGLIRTPDAPLFGIDVAVQKARTALFALGDAASPRIAAARAFVGPAFDATAWSSRAIGNLHRPSYPDGIDGTPPGPFSTSLSSWSPFNVGLQQELVQNQLLNALNADVSKNCGGGGPTPGSPREESGLGVQNGIQVFAGGIPIYRGSERLGAIGVSGDGVDQDDMVAFLGLANAGRRLGTGIGNAPAEIRADTLTPQGTRLRYVQCPQSPFLDSAEENVCAGL